MNEPIDLSKEYQTRDGRKARIYATDGGDRYPVHGAVLCGDCWVAKSWTADGVYDLNDRLNNRADLIPVPKAHRREYWVNCYQEHAAFMESRESAEHYASPSRLACKRVVLEFTEGEGL